MKNILIAVGFALAIVGCTPRVAVDSAQNFNFNKYRTYAWMDSDIKAGDNPIYYNDIATRNVEQTIEKELAERGLQKAAAGRRPDLLIGYHFFVEEKTRMVATNPLPYQGLYGPFYGWGRWGYAGWGPGWWGWNAYGPQYQQVQYKAGTVVVDLVDFRTKRLVWRGAVENAVTDPARISEQLAREVRRIVEKFPDRRSS